MGTAKITYGQTMDSAVFWAKTIWTNNGQG